MDYTNLAREYMQVMHQMRNKDGQKKIHDSMHGEHFMLSYISMRQGGIIPSEISNEMGITSARIAAALNSLEAKGLITRRIDTEDRRRILIDLTEAGREQAKKHFEMIMNITVNMLQYLGEEDATDLVRIMKKLADRSPEEFI
nr:MarR family transcriptional regulator [uncultured Clostridium sp.]